MKKLLCLYLIFVVPHVIYAQSVPVLSFEQFEKNLHKDNDSVYVINFWATWCKPCVEELPAFEDLNAHYRNEKLKVILVSLDFRSQLESNVIPFVKEKNLQSEVLLLYEPNPNSWIDKVSEDWSGAIPATLIFSKGFRKFYEKQFIFDELKAIVEPLIIEK